MVDNAPLIEFQNVSLDINRTALIHDLSFSIKPTGITVVLGPNGAGKSLALRLIAGLLVPGSGKIVGKSGQSSQIPACAMVFQKPVLLRRNTRDNIAFVLKRQGFKDEALAEKIAQALKDARLEEQTNTPARRLSGGEQQRLAMARAMVTEPQILLLDEPTASLDPASTFLIEQLILKANRAGTKIILVTHDIKQARRLADDILFFHGGEMPVQNSAEEFFTNPGCEEAQAYLDGRLPDLQLSP